MGQFASARCTGERAARREPPPVQLFILGADGEHLQTDVVGRRRRRRSGSVQRAPMDRLEDRETQRLRVRSERDREWGAEVQPRECYETDTTRRQKRTGGCNGCRL